MGTTLILAALTCSLFLTAQGAVDAGKQAQLGTGRPGSKYTPPQEQMRTQEQLRMETAMDLQLKERVQQQLRSNIKNYDPSKYTILSQNGEVTLQGSVRTREEAQQMEKEALRVKGVTRVQNNLAVETQQ